MALSLQSKQAVQQMIFERAYEIEQKLSADDYFMAKLCGLRPDQVAETSLTVAVKELKKEMQNPNP